MKSIRCHITVEDTPLCEYNDQIIHILNLTCGYRSINRAKRAIREIRKYRYWPTLKVVIGQCSPPPEYTICERCGDKTLIVNAVEDDGGMVACPSCHDKGEGTGYIIQ